MAEEDDPRSTHDDEPDARPARRHGREPATARRDEGPRDSLLPRGDESNDWIEP